MKKIKTVVYDESFLQYSLTHQIENIKAVLDPGATYVHISLIIRYEKSLILPPCIWTDILRSLAKYQ